MTIQLGEITPRFVPGQFFNVGLNLAGSRVRRAYSAASAPNAPLEFVISRVPNGQLTPSLFDVQPGQTVEVDDGATGFFTLDFLPPGVSDLWLVATGTGIGPYISMLRSGALDQYERVVVVHGVRHVAELTYGSELASFQKRPNRCYVPTVTGQSEIASAGLHGRIPALLTSGALEDASGIALDPERSHVLLCGNPDMIKDAIAALEQRGLRRHKRREPGHITTEKYW